MILPLRWNRSFCDRYSSCWSSLRWMALVQAAWNEAVESPSDMLPSTWMRAGPIVWDHSYLWKTLQDSTVSMCSPAPPIVSSAFFSLPLAHLKLLFLSWLDFQRPYMMWHLTFDNQVSLESVFAVLVARLLVLHRVNLALIWSLRGIQRITVDSTLSC